MDFWVWCGSFDFLGDFVAIYIREKPVALTFEA